VAEAIPPDVPILSDLLLLDPPPDLPRNLEMALPFMRASSDLSSMERVTVGWEVYGLGFQGDPLTFRLRLIREDESLVRRALKRVGLFRRPPALTLSWTEESPRAMEPYFRAVNLDLPALDSGCYVLQLELAMPRRAEVLSQRRVRVH
jgi:hypothetical protein